MSVESAARVVAAAARNTNELVIRLIAFRIARPRWLLCEIQQIGAPPKVVSALLPQFGQATTLRRARIPTGFRLKAQGCRACEATLGLRHPTPTTLKGLRPAAPLVVLSRCAKCQCFSLVHHCGWADCAVCAGKQQQSGDGYWPDIHPSLPLICPNS